MSRILGSARSAGSERINLNKLNDYIYSVGAIDWERRLFDELIPLPDGPSYNSYLIQGSEKTALIDTVDPTKKSKLLRNLSELEVKRIDYVIANHAEQDHSGAIPRVLEAYPMAKVITNPKCKAMLIDLLHIAPDKFIEVQDVEMLSLGNKTLKFIYTPWVHWPETMVTFLEEERILFSCDFFGSHFATSDLFVTDWEKLMPSNKRYYAEIMMPFRGIIANNIKKVEALGVKMIAPSHGPVFDHPECIIDAYKEWVSDKVKNEVIVPYVSMHGSTKEMVDHLIAALINRGIKVKPFDLSGVDIGELAMALVDAATVVIGSPTVLAGAHPLALYAAALANALRPKTRFVSIVGSYGWGGKMVEQLAGMITNLKVEVLEPVIIKGLPKREELVKLDALADQILKKHKEAGLL